MKKNKNIFQFGTFWNKKAIKKFVKIVVGIILAYFVLAFIFITIESSGHPQLSNPYYIFGAFFGKILSAAGLISFLFGFFSKTFITVLLGVIGAAFVDTVGLSIIKGGSGNFQFSFAVALLASSFVGFITYFIISTIREAWQKKHTKTKAYDEQINKETRNKSKEDKSFVFYVGRELASNLNNLKQYLKHLKQKDIFWLAPIVVLVIAILPLPIGYYTLSRLVVCGCSIYVAYNFYNKKDVPKTWIFGFFVVLYNPIIPVYLYEKIIWVFVNIATITAFYLNKEKLK